MLFYSAALFLVLILCRLIGRTEAFPSNKLVHASGIFAKVFLILFPLTFLALFRWNVGVDSVYGASYWVAYHAAATGHNPREFEVLFFLFQQFFASHRIPYFWFLFVHSLIFMVCVSFAIAKGSVHVTWSVLVFFLINFYFDSYSSLRQSLAEAFSLLAWAYMASETASAQRHTKIFALFFVAALFHNTAWINIPLYLICQIHFSQKGLLQFAFFAILMTPVFQVIIPAIMQFVAGDRYDYIGFSRINIIMSFAFFAMCWFFYNSIDQADPLAFSFVNLALCIFILLLNSNVMYLPYRVFDMIKIGYLFIIPFMMNGLKIPSNRFAIHVILILILGAWSLNSILQEGNAMREYQTVFENWSVYTRLP